MGHKLSLEIKRFVGLIVSRVIIERGYSTAVTDRLNCIEPLPWKHLCGMMCPDATGTSKECSLQVCTPEIQASGK
jgi:hypothetical protein